MKSTPATYHPQENSLPDRVCQFFKRVPDEELLTSDIAKKFSASYSGVQTNLAKCVSAGFLKKDGRIYRAGENIGEVSSAHVGIYSTTARNTPISGGTSAA